VPSHVDGSAPLQRVAEQAARLPPGGAVTGWAAGALLGASYLDGLAPDGRTRLPVPLALGATGNIRPSDEVLLLYDELPTDEVIVVLGIPCVIPERAAFDGMRLAPNLTEAVVHMDMLTFGEVTSLRRTQAYVDTRGAGRKGAARARAALAEAREDSWSPNESRTRMPWRHEAGLPEPLLNTPLFDRRGRLLGRPDLLDVESGLVGEFDGADHRGALRHSSDVEREERLRRHGLEVCRITGPDLLVPGRVRNRVLSARSRAKWLAEPDRLWTTTPPAGWPLDPSLAERLDERDFQRSWARAWADEAGRHIPS
jgi:very-short-patch-repair endonuclease